MVRLTSPVYPRLFCFLFYTSIFMHGSLSAMHTSMSCYEQLSKAIKENDANQFGKILEDREIQSLLNDRSVYKESLGIKLVREILELPCSQGWIMIKFLLDHDVKTSDLLYDAIISCDECTADIIFCYGIDSSHKARGGITPLHFAAFLGKEYAVRKLLEHNAPVNERNDYGRTPLFEAVCRPSILNILLEHKADPTLVDNQSETALHVATRFAHLESISLLVAHGANIHARNKIGLTPLHIASNSSSTDVVSFLLARQARVNESDYSGKTPLFYIHSLESGGFETIELLLKHGANINAQAHDGSTILFNALNDHRLTTFLLNSGAQPNKSVSGIYPLHYAVYNGKIGTVRALLEHNADVNARNCFDRTPLTDAMESPLLDFNTKNDLVRLLIHHNAKI